MTNNPAKTTIVYTDYFQVAVVSLYIAYSTPLQFCCVSSHTEMTRLSQPWHKVVTTLAQGCHNAVLQPCHNLGTTLAQPCILKLSQGWTRLSEHCHKVVTRLYEHCHKVATMYLVTTLYFETVVTVTRLLNAS